ncbi:MAG: amidohydrolase family protein [Oscillospiraceae bacterium]|nr:amidohydrolase family protein [Oscillospiraceae bacterium]
MKQRKYFDVHCSAGRVNIPSKDFSYDPYDLLDDMKYYRVHGALVVPLESVDYAFVPGNEWLINLSKKEKRLYGLAPITNTALIETDDKYYFEKLYQNGIKGFITYPQKFGHSLNPKDMEHVAAFLVSRNMPLFISESQAPSTDLIPLLEAFPSLNVVILDTSWGTNRRLFPLLERYKNLHFEISSNQANDIIEITKKHFGIERVLYGTAWSKKSMGALKSLVEYADISEADKDLAAHGNACRLLNIDPGELELYDDSECEFDEITAEIDQGIPLSVPVIDSHTHMARDSHKTVSAIVMMNSGADSIVKKMDRLGIDTILTSSWEGLSTDGKLGNDQTLEAAKKYPGRFLSYSTCNVNYDDDLADWRQYHDKYPEIFVGIKPYWPYQGFDICSDRVKEWYQYANDNNLLLLMHTGSDPIVAKTGELSLQYPNITFILAHTGIDYNVARTNVALCKQRENVMLEITYTSTTRGMIEYLVSEVGAEKVLYGSDLPMRDPAPQLAWVCYAKIPAEDKKLILYGNIKRLLEKGYR